MRALKIGSLVVVALITVVAAVLTIGIPSGFVTSAIQARLERDTGYRIAIAGATRLGIWPALHVTVHDIRVEDPRDREVSNRLAIESVEADVSLRSLLSGHPQVSELQIVRPVLRLPLLRERSRTIEPRPRPAADGPSDTPFPAGHLIVTDGTVVFSSPSDRVESRIGSINADAKAGEDRKLDVAGSAELSEHPLRFAVKATAPADLQQRQNLPVEFNLDAPGLLRQPLTGKAEVRLSGSVLMINGLTGAIGDNPFNGWASVDLASKPLVKLDLDFQHLALAMASARPAGQPSSQGWSDEKIDLSGWNYVDAQMRLSAAELRIGDVRLAPVAFDAALGNGVMRATFAHLGISGGTADGEFAFDASTSNPTYALRADLASVQALPLLSSLADFDRVDGKMQAKLDLRASGDSQRSIIASLGGSVFLDFQDGALRGVNVAKMIRSLTASTLSGWQQSSDQATDLSQLSASFQVAHGQATTSDLALVGPLVRMTGAGTIDLNTQAVGFRVEPKLVMTTQGQGGAGNPVGLGIPVIVQGPWSAPTIYPEVSGILDNPDAAYAKLREMGQGLFGGGAAGAGLSDQIGGNLGGLGALIQQGLGSGAARSQTPAQTTPPNPQTQPDAANAQSTMNGIMKQIFGR
jgi:AsmA protein